MIPGFSCHGHGEISACRRAREEVPDNYCHPSSTFFFLKCSSASLLFVALPALHLTCGNMYGAVGLT